MASACVLNNVTDRNVDIKMNRTKKRALVTGVISPVSAIVYGIILGSIGFGLLALYTNWLTVLIGVIGMVDYLLLYAVTKRRSVHGTLVGTISGATPPVAGYVAVTNQIDTAAVLLFLILVFWQMAHFYAIAMFRAKDYKAAGIPVLPVVKGMRAAKIQIVIYIILFCITTLLLPVLGYGSYTYAILMTIVGLVWLKSAIIGFTTTSDKEDILWSRKVFKFSLLTLLGFSILLSLINVLP